MKCKQQKGQIWTSPACGCPTLFFLMSWLPSKKAGTASPPDIQEKSSFYSYCVVWEWIVSASILHDSYALSNVDCEGSNKKNKIKLKNKTEAKTQNCDCHKITGGLELGCRNLRYSESPNELCTSHTRPWEGWAHGEGRTHQSYFTFN